MAKVARGKKAGAAKKPAPRARCQATTKEGKPCKNPAAPRSKYCVTHKGWKPPKPKAKGKARGKAC
jgi:hypothetical protein